MQNMQSYAVSEDFNAWKAHNVAAISVVAFCSVAYLGHMLMNKTEQTRRERNAQLAQMELVEEVEAKKEAGCALCDKHKRVPSAAGPVASSSTSPLAGAATIKKSRKDKKAKGSIVSSKEALTRSVAVQTEPLISSPVSKSYPPEEVLAFSRVRNETSSSSFIEDDNISETGLSERSPSFIRGLQHLQPVATTSRETSLSSRSVSTDASLRSFTQMRRRSSSGATSLSVASTSALTSLDDQGFMTPPNSTKKGRRARQKASELSARREVVGMPKPQVSRQTSLPVPPVSRSNTLKAVSSSESYWTQSPLTSAPASVMTARPMTRPSSAMSSRSGTSVRSQKKQPEPARSPDRRPSADTTTSSGSSERLPHTVQLPVTTAVPFSPPISPSPHRTHSNGSHYSMPPSPSPSLSARPPSYAASSFDAIAAAQQAAYLIAQQQAYMQQQQQQQQPRSPMGAFFAAQPMMQMPYVPHPNYGMPPQAMMGGQVPSLLNNGRRSSSLSLASDAANGEAKLEVDRLRDQLRNLREKSKKADIENERKNKELEIARWRLQCVEVERKQEDRQTQEAICFFVERAEAAERRVKELEAKLGVPSEESAVQTEAEKAQLTSHGSSTSLQITPTNEIRSPRPHSPAAIAGLDRLDMAQIGSSSYSYAQNGRNSSPTLSPARIPANYGSPPYSPSLSSSGRKRRSGRKYSQTSRPRAHSASSAAVDADEDSDVDDLVILLHSPALEPTRESSAVTLGLGISGSSASSEAGDEAETEPEDKGQTIMIPHSLKVQPATPDAV